VTLHPAVAAVRLAVRRVLAAGVPDDAPVLVACSGGADSLALLSATVFERRSRPSPVVGVTVDHGLQEGSAEHAARVVGQMAALAATGAESVRVGVEPAGQGLEAAAREARYAALDGLAARHDAAAVLLGHTRDDQAETVLMGLARGSGGRSLAGMPRAWGLYRRPLLDVTRAQTQAACEAEGVEFWRDPHNEDLRFTRARVRHRVLPLLEEALGPGVPSSLARTADLLAEDAEALDAWAARTLRQVSGPDGICAPELAATPTAVRHRVIRTAAVEAGSPASELFRVHVLAVASLLHGGGPRQVQLPGHVTAYRAGSSLRFRRTSRPGAVSG
jgi:tRNA(Ile)-lysidine synthase